MAKRAKPGDARPAARAAVPVGGGIPVDPVTGERFGYLPRKAAQRKIIIRRTLGLPWVLAAIVAAALIALAGIAFLLSNPGRPPARFADAGPLSAYPAGTVTALSDHQGWVDRRTGLIVWLTREPYCESDGGWGSRPARWDAGGRANSAADNLRYADAQLARGRLYVDPTRVRPAIGSAVSELGSCAKPRSASP